MIKGSSGGWVGRRFTGKVSEQAFTLVELLCVIGLLSLLLLIAVPAMADFGTNRNLEIAARTMATDLRKTQQKAITAGWSQYVEFRTDARGKDIYRLKDGKTSEYVNISLPEGISIQANNFPLSASVKTMYFSRCGSPHPGGTVTLQNRSGQLLYVIVTPGTGRIRVSETPPANWK
jgi:prepilin-type N-terminal cleavage/methylation domain-containing protein